MIPLAGWRQAYLIIFEADTRAGRAFNVALLIAVLLSMLVMLESVASIRQAYGPLLGILDWCFTILFTVEYLLRLICVHKPKRYATSFFGIIDLIAILPAYLAQLVPEFRFLIDIRVLRLLRTFRIFKLTRYLGEADELMQAMRSNRRKISVALLTVLMLVVVLGTLMYVIEGDANGFTSIPTSIHWAIVTLTTVGFGDITDPGRPGCLVAGDDHRLRHHRRTDRHRHRRAYPGSPQQQARTHHPPLSALFHRRT